jgi:hypothetical protein
MLNDQYITELALNMYNKWTELRVLRAETRVTATAIRVSLVRLDRSEEGQGSAASGGGTQGILAHHLRRASRLIDVLEKRLDDSEQQDQQAHHMRCVPSHAHLRVSASTRLYPRPCVTVHVLRACVCCRSGNSSVRSLVKRGRLLLDNLWALSDQGHRPGLWFNGEEFAVRVHHDGPFVVLVLGAAALVEWVTFKPSRPFHSPQFVVPVTVAAAAAAAAADDDDDDDDDSNNHNNIVADAHTAHDAHTGQVTADDSCQLEEQRRRKAVRSCAYYCRVLINGHVVCSSPVTRVALPSFSVPVHVHASVALHRRPGIVTFEVWQTGWLMNTRVACVPVPIPLAFTADSVPVESVEPFDDWLGFTSTTAMLPTAVQFTLPAPAAVTHSVVASR